MKKRVLLWWSSGKDSAWTLKVLREEPGTEVVGLVTTVNAAHDRVSMHAVRLELLSLQAKAAGLPLFLSRIPHPCSDTEYETAVTHILDEARSLNVNHMAFGDLFLQDVRQYREQLFKDTGINPIFPLWGRATGDLAREMIDTGLGALITCVDPGQLPSRFAGCCFDASFLQSLPEGVDPCGERGEFHTFVFAAPVFAAPLAVELGEIVTRDAFVFADVIPCRGDAESRPGET